MTGTNHGQLYYSLHLLFERLGWELYRPTGTDWFKEGFWAYSNNPGVVNQYLETPKDAIPDGKGLYMIEQYEGPRAYVHRGITLERFKQEKFDYVVASVNQHEPVYSELVKRFQKDSKLIRQSGNVHDTINFALCRNILNSTLSPVPSEINHVRYHPEIDLRDYHWSMPKDTKRITSMLHYLKNTIDKDAWYEYKSRMRDFTFVMHGADGDDGQPSEREKLLPIFQTGFLWHLKSWGDGYGFSAHGAFALGRPVITRFHYYSGLMASLLLDDGKTGIDLDLGTMEQNISKIRALSDQERYRELSRSARRRFEVVCNFEEEFYEIRKFLERAT